MIDLKKYEGKKVKIITTSEPDDVYGPIFVGTAIDYTDADDNDTEVASICIGDIELYENEIVSIEIIE